MGEYMAARTTGVVSGLIRVGARVDILTPRKAGEAAKKVREITDALTKTTLSATPTAYRPAVAKMFEENKDYLHRVAQQSQYSANPTITPNHFAVRSVYPGMPDIVQDIKELEEKQLEVVRTIRANGRLSFVTTEKDSPWIVQVGKEGSVPMIGFDTRIYLGLMQKHNTPFNTSGYQGVIDELSRRLPPGTTPNALLAKHQDGQKLSDIEFLTVALDPSFSIEATHALRYNSTNHVGLEVENVDHFSELLDNVQQKSESVSPENPGNYMMRQQSSLVPPVYNDDGTEVKRTSYLEIQDLKAYPLSDIVSFYQRRGDIETAKKMQQQAQQLGIKDDEPVKNLVAFAGEKAYALFLSTLLISLREIFESASRIDLPFTNQQKLNFVDQVINRMLKETKGREDQEQFLTLAKKVYIKGAQGGLFLLPPNFSC
jgi:hypothetical protein